MEIIPVVPRGYCKGVYRAIKIAKQTALEYPDQPIYMLGMIVHNKYVVEACKLYDIQCIEDKHLTRLELLDKINEGVVIFTAHGVSQKVKDKATAKGLIVVDASCEDVLKTHDTILSHIEHGDCIYIGKKNHPEAEGACGLAENVYLVSTKEDIDQLPPLHNVLITNQTTMSIMEIQAMIDHALQKYPQAKVADEICNATRIRQQAILNLKDIDCLIVVGDPTSNNSKKLKDIAQKHIPKIYMIETVHDLQEDMFAEVKRLAITSGASTPTYLTEQIIQTIQEYDQTHILNKKPIEIDKILD
ncbi:MAG: 4-hydroxy-3-methylbut-2-enyl diphosphate reductase [Erysipelotrichaceae bacterium]|nr:4-hydroxy-3-methylbut-2-enyl diphosphate reductase [Erysipelotrichaceae bacterium]MDY5252295.1 4-hydroxy-3-methylbut-2-enyl diphosphate reductase [Erysipelotrichaceae bacterium]